MGVFTIDRFIGVPYTAAPLLQCIFEMFWCRHGCANSAPAAVKLGLERIENHSQQWSRVTVGPSGGRTGRASSGVFAGASFSRRGNQFFCFGWSGHWRDGSRVCGLASVLAADGAGAIWDKRAGDVVSG